MLEHLNLEVKLSEIGKLKSELEDCVLLILTTRPKKYPYNNWELKLFRKFVENGGSLLHLSNHKPFHKEDSKLCKKFEYEFCNKWHKSRNNEIFSVKVDYEPLNRFQLNWGQKWKFSIRNCGSKNI